MDRRSLINCGLFTGFAAMSAPEPAMGQQNGQQDESAVARAIDTLDSHLERARLVSPELARIREQQRVFLRANQKFPDFIEVGIGVWESLIDWHVRHRLSPSTSRTTDGRYLMAVPFSTLELRSDQPENYVGPGVDAR